MNPWSKLATGDCLKQLKRLKDDSVDLIVTDPPYGISFMGRDWDKAVPPVEVWRECLRVLKPGAFAFIMSSPRQDCLARMILNLEEAGFVTGFSMISWVYATGFPKAQNLSKAADKRAGAERKVVGTSSNPNNKTGGYSGDRYTEKRETRFGVVQDQPDATLPVTDEAKRLDGAYAGAQFKPALEPILCTRKPLTPLAALTITTSHVVELLNEVSSWQSASTAALNSFPSQIPRGSIARDLAQESIVADLTTHLGKVAGTYGLMDMWTSTLEALTDDRSTNWNIDWLWRRTLAVILGQASTYTTETVIALTTELQTLNSYLAQTTHGYITQDGIRTSGVGFAASTVDGILTSVYLRSRSPSITTAPDSATTTACREQEHAPASGAEASSEATTRSENTAAKSVTTSRRSRGKGSRLSARTANTNSTSSQRTSPAAKQASSTATENAISRRGTPESRPILVVMKPLAQKTYLDQALDNGKGCTWLDDCRIPIVSQADAKEVSQKNQHTDFGSGPRTHNVYGDITKADRDNYDPTKGRFPANMLVEDDALNDGSVGRARGNVTASEHALGENVYEYGCTHLRERGNRGDTGSPSRYFDLDAWWADRIGCLPEQVQRVFPNLMVPKASKREKNAGCEGLPEKAKPQMGEFKDNPGRATPKSSPTPRPNHHPTAKPVRLMSYLVMLGSREGDVVLDPYMGSGTTGVAAVGLQRNFLGCDLDPEYVRIAVSRIKWVKENGLGALSKAPKPKRKHKQQPKKTLWERKSK